MVRLLIVWLPRLSNSSDQKIEHRVLYLAMVQTERERVQMAIHVLPRDVNMCRADGVFERLSEALDRVDEMHRIRPVAVQSPLLRAVVNSNVLEAVAVQ